MIIIDFKFIINYFLMKVKGEKRQEIPSNQIKDRTFNRLKELQVVIKKESALKELCKKYIIITKIIL